MKQSGFRFCSSKSCVFHHWWADTHTILTVQLSSDSSSSCVLNNFPSDKIKAYKPHKATKLAYSYVFHFLPLGLRKRRRTAEDWKRKRLRPLLPVWCRNQVLITKMATLEETACLTTWQNHSSADKATLTARTAAQ